MLASNDDGRDDDEVARSRHRFCRATLTDRGWTQRPERSRQPRLLEMADGERVADRLGTIGSGERVTRMGWPPTAQRLGSRKPTLPTGVETVIHQSSHHAAATPARRFAAPFEAPPGAVAPHAEPILYDPRRVSSAPPSCRPGSRTTRSVPSSPPRWFQPTRVAAFRVPPASVVEAAAVEPWPPRPVAADVAMEKRADARVSRSNF